MHARVLTAAAHGADAFLERQKTLVDVTTLAGALRIAVDCVSGAFAASEVYQVDLSAQATLVVPSLEGHNKYDKHTDGGSKLK